MKTWLLVGGSFLPTVTRYSRYSNCTLSAAQWIITSAVSWCTCVEDGCDCHNSATSESVKTWLQTPTLEDSDSEDGYVPGSHRHTGHDRSLPTAAEGRPPPGVQQKGSSEHRWHPSLQNALTAYAQPRDVDAHRHNGHDRNASTSAQPNVPGYDRRGSDHGAGPSSHANGAVHTGFIRNGNLTGDLTGLNAQLDDRDPSGAGQDANGPEGEPALAVGKIKLKIRRPVSAASDTYDESWYSEHLDRQPDLQGDIQDLTEVTDGLHSL